MTKDEWRVLDKEPGQRVRLIADGRVGDVLRYHKDAAVVRFHTRNGTADTKYCPCETLQDPDLPWKAQTKTGEKGKAEPKESRVHICQYCGKPFRPSKAGTKYCSRKCQHDSLRKDAREKREALKPSNWQGVVKWYLTGDITQKAGAALCRVPLYTFLKWVEEYKAKKEEP